MIKPQKDTYDTEYKSKRSQSVKCLEGYDPKDFNMTPEEAKMFDVQQVYVF